MSEEYVGNPALVYVGCEVCPQNLSTEVEPEELERLLDDVGKTKKCRNCETQWTLNTVEVHGRFGNTEGEKILATPKYWPLMKKDTRVVMRMMLDADSFKKDEE